MHRWSPIDDNKPEGWLGDAFTWLARLRALRAANGDLKGN
jgi:hypothetical protein